jgi:hypothetical protein
MKTGFFTARRVLPPSNSAISFSIPSRERQSVFSNAKGAASAFGTNKAATVVGLVHDGSPRKRSDSKYSWVKLDPAWDEASFWIDFVNSIPLRRSTSGFHRLGYARRYETSVK